MTSITTGGKTTTYAYDADGIRTEKVINGVTHHYVTRGGRLMRESFLSGSAEIIMDFSYDESGRPFAVSYSKDGGASFTTYYYATNLQGDVVMIFGRAAIKDANDNVTGYTVRSYGYYTYDAWGNVTAYSSTGGTPASTSLIYRNPLRYRGYIYDTETGFYYLQSRYYDPANHRFINADSLASTGQGFVGTNMFAYCLNNPVVRTDASGNFSRVWEVVKQQLRKYNAQYKIALEEKYSYDNWVNASYDQRLSLLQEHMEDTATTLGIEDTPKFKTYYSATDEIAYYDHTTNTVNVNENALINPNDYFRNDHLQYSGDASCRAYQVIRHEVFHAYQHCAVDGKIPGEAQINIDRWRQGFDSYVSPFHDINAYYNNPVEVDARYFAFLD